MTKEEFGAEYIRLGHAVQTGVAYEHGFGSQDGTPKHLRTGLNCVMADLGSLSQLLIDKGLITEAEYFDAILAGLQREVDAYQRRLSERSGGATITLA